MHCGTPEGRSRVVEKEETDERVVFASACAMFCGHGGQGESERSGRTDGSQSRGAPAADRHRIPFLRPTRTLDPFHSLTIHGFIP